MCYNICVNRILRKEKETMSEDFDNENVQPAPAEQKPQGKRRVAKIVTACVLMAIANVIFFLALWIKYDDVLFDQVLYQLKSPMDGTNSGIVWEAVLNISLYSIIAIAVELLLYFFLSGRLLKYLGKLAWYTKYCATRVAGFFKKHFVTLASLLLVLSTLLSVLRLEIHSFVANLVVKSNFIEENYVDPDDVEMTFPEEKRNLIFIFLESLENTFAEPGVSENITENYIPELTKLADENTSFSSNGGKYGAQSYVGTRWTAAAMFAQTAGMIIKVPVDADFYYGENETYMPGITALGDILADAGYQQSVLFGSDSGFAAKDAYFKEHGNYNIIDVPSLVEAGKLDKDYKEGWGFEDEKLFEFSKEEITRLAATGQPFNFTTLTSDTHFPRGYKCRLCQDEHEEQYANVLSCSSRQIYDFILWIQAQPFYENTTVILSGDHLTMDPEFLKNMDEDYIRTSYNCIINPAVEPVRKDDRKFGTFDMFPTTLAALGVQIKGERLGIGTNLFSDVDTLTEIHGFEKLNAELSKHSEFYVNTFYDEESKKKLQDIKGKGK